MYLTVEKRNEQNRTKNSKSAKTEPKMTGPTETWFENHQTALARMQSDFAKGDLKMVTVTGVPDKDKCWISACIQWKPIRFAGSLGRCWLQFETSEKASKFATEFFGKAFKGSPLEITGTKLKNPGDFDQLIVDLKKIAHKNKDTLDYDIKPSELLCCRKCGTPRLPQ